MTTSGHYPLPSQEESWSLVFPTRPLIMTMLSPLSSLFNKDKSTDYVHTAHVALHNIVHMGHGEIHGMLIALA